MNVLTASGLEMFQCNQLFSGKHWFDKTTTLLRTGLNSAKYWAGNLLEIWN